MSKLEIGMYAGEARELGLEVPENVPDCAKLEPLDIRMLNVEDGGSEQVVINLEVDVEWRWVTAKFEIDKDGNIVNDAGEKQE